MHGVLLRHRPVQMLLNRLALDSRILLHVAMSSSSINQFDLSPSVPPESLTTVGGGETRRVIMLPQTLLTLRLLID
jgi:hypothetical protein